MSTPFAMQWITIQSIHLVVLTIVSSNKIPPITEWKLYGNTLEFQDKRHSKRVNELQANLFCQVPNQVRIVRINAHIQLLDEDAFDGLQSITDLILRSNCLSHVHRTHFKDIEHLERLDLSYNQISVIGKGAFVDLNYVQVLNLAGNRIHMIQKSIFAIDNQLQLLDLSRNIICNLSTDMFDHLNQLEELRICYNCIWGLAGNTPHLPAKLKTLQVNHNQVCYTCFCVNLTTSYDTASVDIFKS